jgi:hypothetical protein
MGYSEFVEKALNEIPDSQLYILLPDFVIAESVSPGAQGYQIGKLCKLHLVLWYFV